VPGEHCCYGGIGDGRRGDIGIAPVKVDATVAESSSEPGDRGFSCATAVIRGIVFLFVSVNSEMIYVLAEVHSLFIYYKG